MGSSQWPYHFVLINKVKFKFDIAGRRYSRRRLMEGGGGGGTYYICAACRRHVFPSQLGCVLIAVWCGVFSMCLMGRSSLSISCSINCVIQNSCFVITKVCLMGPVCYDNPGFGDLWG